jgi:hypothetical protein
MILPSNHPKYLEIDASHQALRAIEHDMFVSFCFFAAMFGSF